MTKLYELTKQTHELVKKLAKQENIKIKLIPTFFVDSDGSEYDRPAEITSIIPAIKAPQIRQILQAFEGVLGENPEWQELNKQENDLNPHGSYVSWDVALDHGITQGLLFYTPEFLSEFLCQKWLDGLNPMFNSKPEKVLTELNEILENLIK